MPNPESENQVTRPGYLHTVQPEPGRSFARPEEPRHGQEELAPVPPRAEEAGDARLIELARDGDDSAFACLVTRYERKLIRVLNRLMHDEELARDLAQETFWKAYTRLAQFDTTRRFGPWLFRIGVNQSLDHLRSHRAPSPISIDQPRGRLLILPELADPDPRIREELAQEVRLVLDRMPLAYRTILVLRDLEGFSSAEVAAIVGRREATVRWRLARARELFRQSWERRQEQGCREGPKYVA